MRKAFYISASCLLLQACSQERSNNSLLVAREQGQTNYVSEVPSQAGEQSSLIGEWETGSIESNMKDWKDLKRVSLFVYSDVQVNRDAEIKGINAELLIEKQGEKLQPAYDTQPVYKSKDALYFGPLGSAYHFRYVVANQDLSLNLVTRDGPYLRLHFSLASSRPCKPRHRRTHGYNGGIVSAPN